MKLLSCDEFNTKDPHSGNPVCDHRLIEAQLLGLRNIPIPRDARERVGGAVEQMLTASSTFPLLEERACVTCGRELPLMPYFFRPRSGQNGFHYECRECEREHHREYKQSHPEHVKVSHAKYRETHRTQIRAYERQRHHDRKQERTEYMRKYWAEHRKAHRASDANRRALKSQNLGTHSADDIRAQYERQKGRCYYCGSKLSANGCHVDHVMPLSLGGGNGPENLVVTCPKCNLSKGSKHPMDFSGQLL